jgi:ribosomal protein L28
MSKLDPTDRYFQKPNLHEVKLKSGKKTKVCTKCQRKLGRESKLK